MCQQNVRRMEVMRLLGDKVNPHNQMKENRLCGFSIYNYIKKLLLDYPYYLDFPYFIKSRKTGKSK